MRARSGRLAISQSCFQLVIHSYYKRIAFPEKAMKAHQERLFDNDVAHAYRMCNCPIDSFSTLQFWHISCPAAFT